MASYQRVNNQIFTVASLLSPEECQEYIGQAEAIGFSDAPINTAFGPKIMSDVRNNQRVILDDQSLADKMWAKVEDFVPHIRGEWDVCGVNERFRFYRYDAGQQFDWHFDGAFHRSPSEVSQLTFMIYLNEGFEGGETSFDEVDIEPAEGKALFFVHAIRHKGQPVRQGRKYVLRTDVMYRLNSAG